MPGSEKRVPEGLVGNVPRGRIAVGGHAVRRRVLGASAKELAGGERDSTDRKASLARRVGIGLLLDGMPRWKGEVVQRLMVGLISGEER